MLIIGCDYHPSMQQIAYVDTETGEGGERRLMHRDGEAERFYRELTQRPIEVRVGMEATGYARWWFLRPTSRLGRKEPNDDHYATGAKRSGLLYSVKWLPCDGRRRSTRLLFSWRSYGMNSPRSVPSISAVRILRAHFGRD